MEQSRDRRFQIKSLTISAPELPPGLYLVSTPIGNLSDITLRALETLAAANVIACEDTRTSGILLKRFGIDRPKISYNEHNAASRGPDLLRQIEEGASVALISDAGTPLVSDPGYRLVAEAVERNLSVIPIPGASAPLAALVASGLASDDFRFCGFLPSKAQARLQRLESLSQATSTLIFFESPNRITATLAAMGQAFGKDRPGVVARELTKMHETIYRGPIGTLIDQLDALDKVRGEIVIVIEGASDTELSAADIDLQLRTALKSMKTKDAASHVAKLSGLPKQELYRQALQIKDEQ